MEKLTTKQQIDRVLSKSWNEINTLATTIAEEFGGVDCDIPGVENDLVEGIEEYLKKTFGEKVEGKTVYKALLDRGMDKETAAAILGGYEGLLEMEPVEVFLKDFHGTDLFKKVFMVFQGNYTAWDARLRSCDEAKCKKIIKSILKDVLAGSH